MFRWITAGVLVTFGAQVTISFFGLWAVGAAANMGNLAWVVPVGIDVPILVFTGAALAQQRRGNKGYRWFASIFVFIMTAVSCLLNYLHGVDTYDLSTNMGRAALIVASLAPLLIFANVEVLTHLVTKAPPAPRDPAAPKRAPVKKAPAKRKPAAPKPQPEPVAEAPAPVVESDAPKFLI